MGQGISVFSDKTLMASIDKNAKMSFAKKMGAQTELSYKLFGARGHLRSELKGISYSDYNNLMHYASKQINLTPSFDPFHQLWLQVLQELQSMEDEFSPKKTSDGIKRDGDDRAVIPIPSIPNPQVAARIHNSGYVSGNGNGSVFNFRDYIVNNR